MAGRVCVRNDVEKDRAPNSATPRNPKPEGQSGATEEENEEQKHEGRDEASSARWLQDEPFERHTTATQNAKIGQHFVWVMVVRCGERSPHKPPPS